MDIDIEGKIEKMSLQIILEIDDIIHESLIKCHKEGLNEKAIFSTHLIALQSVISKIIEVFVKEDLLDEKLKIIDMIHLNLKKFFNHLEEKKRG